MVDNMCWLVIGGVRYIEVGWHCLSSHLYMASITTKVAPTSEAISCRITSYLCCKTKSCFAQNNNASCIVKPCVQNVLIYILRASSSMLKIKEFKTKIENASSRRGSNPGHLWLELPVLCHCAMTAGQLPTLIILYVLHRMHQHWQLK